MQSPVFNIELNLFSSIMGVLLTLLHKSTRQSFNEANSNCVKDVVHNDKKT